MAASTGMKEKDWDTDGDAEDVELRRLKRKSRFNNRQATMQWNIANAEAVALDAQLKFATG